MTLRNDIGLERFLERFDGQFRGRKPIERDSRIVHKDVEPTVAALHLDCGA